jgi:hypothetical protein
MTQANQTINLSDLSNKLGLDAKDIQDVFDAATAGIDHYGGVEVAYMSEYPEDRYTWKAVFQEDIERIDSIVQFLVRVRLDLGAPMKILRALQWELYSARSFEQRKES